MIVYLIRYGEISTKGRNRNKFVEKLKKSIRIGVSFFSKNKNRIRSGSDVHFIKWGKCKGNY